MDRRTGAVNSQGVVLVGIATGRKLPASNENSAKLSRLRKLFRSNFGVDEPFFPYNPKEGWSPRFQIVDGRGATDERARRDAERRSVSLEQYLESGARLNAHLISEDPSEQEGDDADRWLRENDPTV
jgi:hypothetical protein